MADVHREAAMRLVACLTMCLMPILANTAQTDAQAPSDPQAYCVNYSADFYPYTGEPCKSGYQLGAGNCRKTDGRIVAPRAGDGGFHGAVGRRVSCKLGNEQVAAKLFKGVEVSKDDPSYATALRIAQIPGRLHRSAGRCVRSGIAGGKQ
jgi:hypothetical protein